MRAPGKLECVSPAEPQKRTGALGRALITVYLILAVAATMRAAYQILTKFDEAPLAYALSLLAGVVYIVATVALIKRTGAWRSVAWAALIFEFSGVLVVGALSLLVPEHFAHDSVWSRFGSGYLFIPLVLPIAGMIWLSSAERPVRDRVGASAGDETGGKDR